MLMLNYGSARSLEVLKAHLHELAAVLVEPVQSRKPDFQRESFCMSAAADGRSRVALILMRSHRIPRSPRWAQRMVRRAGRLATYGKIVGAACRLGFWRATPAS